MKKHPIFFTFLFLIVLNSNPALGQQCEFKQASSKSSHALGITPSGKLFGWGSNSIGQIGLGTVATGVGSPSLVNSDTDWKKVETGNASSFSIALKNNGSLWFFGNNSYNSDAGFSNSISYLTPTSITPNFVWKDFSAGYFRVAAIRDDNTLWGWGNNGGNCLGIAGSAQVDMPTKIGADNDWSKVSCGLFHTLALKSNGTIWACGYNNVGQLGNGSSGTGTFAPTLTQVGTDTDWKEILAAAAFCLAIKTDGTLWAWGLNETGQLGDGTIINKLVPTKVGTGTDWKSIGYSGYASAAIKTNGTLWTWGLGSNGQLGNGSTSNALTPTRIGTQTDWAAVFGGGGYGFAGTTGDHFLALKQNFALYSWGVNQNGTLGNSTVMNSNVPNTICNTVQIDQVEYENDIKISPNPASESIQVMTNVEISNLILINMLGKVVKRQRISTELNVSDLQNGLYILQIETTDRSIYQKKVLVAK
jgi:alpha-tubulin suppressor-like RCC1 family protein